MRGLMEYELGCQERNVREGGDANGDVLSGNFEVRRKKKDTRYLSSYFGQCIKWQGWLEFGTES